MRRDAVKPELAAEVFARDAQLAGLLIFAMWMQAHQTIDSVTLGVRKGAA